MCTAASAAIVFRPHCNNLSAPRQKTRPPVKSPHAHKEEQLLGTRRQSLRFLARLKRRTRRRSARRLSSPRVVPKVLIKMRQTTLPGTIGGRPRLRRRPRAASRHPATTPSELEKNKTVIRVTAPVRNGRCIYVHSSRARA